MAEILRMTGFDLGLDFDILSSNMQLGDGVDGGKAAQFSSSGNALSTLLFPAVDSSGEAFSMSFRVRCSSTGSSQGRNMGMYITDSGGTNLFVMRASSDSAPAGWQFSGSGISVKLPAAVNAWLHMELLIKPGSPSHVTWKANGEDVYSGDASAITDVGSVSLGSTNTSGTNASGTWRFDDVVIARSDNHLGDLRVRAFVPTADGAYGEWTPSVGSDLFSTVNDFSDSSSSISASVAGDKATFTTNADVGPGDVLALQVQALAQLPDGGARQLRMMARSGGTDGFSDPVDVPAVLGTVARFLPNNPDGGVPWTSSAVESAEFGLEVFDGA